MIKELDEVELIFVKALEEQSQLDSDRIINGHSVRGAELAKYVEDKIESTYNLDDVVIIFDMELEEDDDICITEEIDDRYVRQGIAVNFGLVIYGNASDLMAKTLKSRFESDYVNSYFNSYDVNIYKVSSGQTTTEIVNNTVWQRTDMSIKLDFEMNIQKVSDFKTFKQLNSITTESF